MGEQIALGLVVMTLVSAGFLAGVSKERSPKASNWPIAICIGVVCTAAHVAILMITAK